MGYHGPVTRPVAALGAILCAIAVLGMTAAADAGSRKRRRSNMPPGWSWPPTDAMKRTGEQCLARLDQLGVAWRKAPRTLKVATPVVIPKMVLGGIRLVSIYRKPPFVMGCHLALALAEHGPRLYRLGVRELRFSSIHRYTRVRTNGKQLRSLSRHALGLAVDVWHVVDEAGVVHSVKEHYLGGDALLRAVEEAVNASGAFRMVLTPANDPQSHDDHFHFEAAVAYREAKRAPRERAARKPKRRAEPGKGKARKKKARKNRRRPRR